MRVFITGALVGFGAALLAWLGGGLSLTAVALLGTAAGAALVLIDDSPALRRILGFLIGVGAAWLGYALRAGVLPDTDGGRAVAVFLVVLTCTGLTLFWAPLWTSLLGAMAMIGAYERTFTASPPDFLAESVTALTALLVAVAVGLLAGTVAARAPRRAVPAEPPKEEVDVA